MQGGLYIDRSPHLVCCVPSTVRIVLEVVILQFLHAGHVTMDLQFSNAACSVQFDAAGCSIQHQTHHVNW